jgi:hypothetical protein
MTGAKHCGAKERKTTEQDAAENWPQNTTENR